YDRLLPAAVGTERRESLRRLETSCSGFVLLLGVEGEHPQLAHHNIFFTQDYRAEFDDIFRRGIPPDAPTVYVAITSKSDPSHEPPGHENRFVRGNAPARGPRFDWPQQKDVYRSRVLDMLAGFGLDVRDRIRRQVSLTPQEIQQMTGAWRGA